ncbi:glycosyltransferase family 87 protein [Plantactinospora sp. KLBMP9567]|uniref:glycosyltransferase family 87 protein n=1 Tax=Plantactinospora sp. KLBMP9567 TaxID=3085900 RepID=UPI0029829DFC|nr:glycosyltransferase family 87 protein [Plantactinospora sp. KLBMP9567]MDW5322730.1 glycosyltransferase family 87 protein [Plantactinospora sp. KLBMP9567]
MGGQSHPRGRLRSAIGVVGVWAVTRAVFVLIYANVINAPVGNVFADVALYRRWTDALLDWQVPHDDPMWQYPPGAAALFRSLRHVAGDPVGSYEITFFTLALVADLLVLLTLLRLARGDGLLLGAGAWAVVVPLLNLLTYARYDIFVTAAAVIALAAMLRRPVVAGAALGIGALIKVWPAVLLIAARPFGGLRPILTGFVVTLAALGGALTLAFTGAWSGFTGNQADRGLQIESIGATPLVLARLGDRTIDVRYTYGAMEFVDHPLVRPVAIGLPVLTVLGLGALGLWWLVSGRRRIWTGTFGFDVALLALLTTVVTSRVFSPQYMLWLIGVAAVCLTRRDTTQRVASALIMVATALTSALFPWYYAQVSTDPDWPGTVLLVVRNVVVVAALGTGFHALTRRARERTAGGSAVRLSPV